MQREYFQTRYAGTQVLISEGSQRMQSGHDCRRRVIDKVSRGKRLLPMKAVLEVQWDTLRVLGSTRHGLA